MSQKKRQSYGIGHRKRLRERVLKSGASSLADYELLEAALFSVIPRRDTKPMAKALIEQMGGLSAVLEAGEDLLKEKGLSHRVSHLLQLPALLAQALTQPQQNVQTILQDTGAILAYLQKERGSASPLGKGWSVFYVNVRNALLLKEFIPDNGEWGKNIQKTLAVSMIRRAIFTHASAVIIAYDTNMWGKMPKTALQGHKILSEEIHNALKLFDITMHDYICLYEKKAGLEAYSMIEG
ncbi:JAB domain-containing protein [Entomobacter blattae]|uniref:hypothetical protein n=1 Tax=Entomobacter blattae TaxID=2762277 RepID=UPI00193B5D09|nr:hypothetical protein [Entomobacter blattae]